MAEYCYAVIYANCRNQDHYVECRYAECHYAECRYFDCHGAIHETSYNPSCSNFITYLGNWLNGNPSKQLCLFDIKITVL
jgi:hypothetical protein